MSSNSLEKIPNQMKQYILSYVSVRDLRNCMLINKTFLDLILQSKLIWKSKLLELGHERESQLDDLEEFYSNMEKAENSLEEKSNHFYLHCKYRPFSKDARSFWKHSFHPNQKIRTKISFETFIKNYESISEYSKKDLGEFYEFLLFFLFFFFLFLITLFIIFSFDYHFLLFFNFYFFLISIFF